MAGGVGVAADSLALVIQRLLGRGELPKRVLGATIAPLIESATSFAALHAAQQHLVDAVSSDLISRRFPPERSRVVSLLKLAVSVSEARGHALEEQQAAEADSSEEADAREQGPVSEALLELFLAYSAATAAGPAVGAATTAIDGKIKDEENGRFFSALQVFPAAPTPDPVFVGIQVASQFVNVGLALWPASFLTADLVATLNAPANSTSTPLNWWPAVRSRLLSGPAPASAAALNPGSDVLFPPYARVLELGAGVGLVPCVLAARGGEGASRLHLVQTDYQPNILDNCAANLARNDCPQLTLDELASGRGDSDPIMISASVGLLDWTEPEARDQLISTVAQPCVTLAADCVYDAGVIPDLAGTLRTALTWGSTDGARCRVAIVVQAHRNDVTQRMLHDELRTFAAIASYHFDRHAHVLRPTVCFGDAEIDGGTNAPPSLPLLRTTDFATDDAMADIMFVHFLAPLAATTSNE